MELKFIGTGSGKASLKRFHSSFIISTEGYNLLIDSGDGVSRALMHQKIPFNSVNGILFSHFHPDHYTGFPSLIVQMKMNKRNTPLDIICHESYYEFLKTFLYNSYVFEEKLGFKLVYKLFKDNKPFDAANGLNFVARQNTHLELSIKNQRDKPGFSSSSFSIHIKNKKIIYTGDIGSYNDLYLFRDKKIDVMISEITHISGEDLADALKKLKPQKLYITHISDEDEEKVSKLNFLLPDKERKKVIQAFDGLEVKL
jgi:ribonuclease BN (tRNA processing enzyme)